MCVVWQLVPGEQDGQLLTVVVFTIGLPSVYVCMLLNLSV